MRCAACNVQITETNSEWLVYSTVNSKYKYKALVSKAKKKK